MTIGIDVDFKKVGAYLYVYLYHSKSKLLIYKFSNSPINIGKREFLKRLDNSDFNKIDWTKEAEDLIKIVNYDIILNAVKQMNVIKS